MRSAAVKLVAEGEQNELIDVDCQRFYGFAAWTKPREASALREEFRSALETISSADTQKAEILRRTDSELYLRFPDLFEEFSNGD